MTAGSLLAVTGTLGSYRPIELNLFRGINKDRQTAAVSRPYEAGHRLNFIDGSLLQFDLQFATTSLLHERAVETINDALGATEARSENASAENMQVAQDVEDPRIAALRDVKDDWDGYGAEAPNETAIHLASSLLSVLNKIDYQPLRIIESAEGAVLFRFGSSTRYAHIEVFNDGEMLAAVHEDGQMPKVWDVTMDNVEAAVRIIDEFSRG